MPANTFSFQDYADASLASQPKPQLVADAVQERVLPQQPQLYACPTQSSHKISAGDEIRVRIRRRRKQHPQKTSPSPFSDCIDAFGRSFVIEPLSRPTDGIIDGFIKLSWPRKTAYQVAASCHMTQTNSDNEAIVSRTTTHALTLFDATNRPTSSATTLAYSDSFCDASTSPLVPFRSEASSCSLFHSIVPSPETPDAANLRYIPFPSGFGAIMDGMDRKLLQFCMSTSHPTRVSDSPTDSLWKI